MSQSHPDDTTAATDRTDPEALRAELDVLREENDRLRNEVQRAQQTKYRRSALALAGVGVVSLLAAAVFTGARDVLLVLGAIGVFAGVLTYYLTPERVLTASIAAQLANTIDTLDGALTDELGLRNDVRVYTIPTADPRDARLFVPQHADYQLPASLDSLFVVGDDEQTRGIALPATGAALFAELTDEFATPLNDTADAPTRIADALVEQFELAASVEPDSDETRVTYAVRSPALGPLGGFDDPVVSTLAVATAAAFDAPVDVDVTTPDDDDRADALITCRHLPTEHRAS